MLEPQNQNFERWDAYELGVPEIDGDHRTLVLMVNQIRTLAGQVDGTRLETFLDRFIAFSESHFEREEALLENWGFPNVLEHRGYHRALLDKARNMKRAGLTAVTAESLLEFANELTAFIIDDVIRGDMKFKSFLQKKGLTQ